MTESAERPLGLGVRATDLAEVTRELGPVASIYLVTEADVENAAQRSETRWKTVRARLEDAGATETALDAIAAFVGDAHERGSCLAAVADDLGLRHVEHGTEAPTQDRAWWEPVPRVGRIVAWRQRFPSHIVVVADRRGADVYIPRYAGQPIHREAGGESETLPKVHAGGWSEPRYQRHAEEGWADNAQAVAKEIRYLSELVEPRVVIAVGDGRALQLIREDLPDDLLSITQVIDGGRSRDGSRDAVWDAVRDRVEELARNETEAVVATFSEERGQDDRAAEGAAGTLEALARSQVEVLLVHDDVEDERTAWAGPSPDQVAAREETLGELGIDPTQARLVDAAIRAALGTGARVRILDEPLLADGIGAILRWSG